MEKLCCVCGDPLDSDNLSRCYFCGGEFHLAWSTTAQVKKCGHYWLNGVSCGLAFVCLHCQGQLSPSDSQSPNHPNTS